MADNDIYKMIEESVVNQLENGLIPWRCCYHYRGASVAYSHSSGRVYSPLNQFFLNEPGEYWTFKQAKTEGYSIRKGCHAKKIVFWKILTCADEKPDGEVVAKQIPCIRLYSVFHESDIVGLPPREVKQTEDDLRKNTETIEVAQNVVDDFLKANQDLSIVTYDRTPCFAAGSKTIYIPEKCQFDSLVDYYATLFHEMVHSTKLFIERKVNSYAREELVAEIGAAFLCGFCGFKEEEVIKNHEAYCANWLKSIRGNVKDLISASSLAEKAVRYILGKKAVELFPEPETETVEAVA